MNLKEKLINIDNGRFKKLIDALSIEEECYRCHSFNPKAKNSYRCAVTGCCIGHILSEDLLAYLLKKLKESDE